MLKTLIAATLLSGGTMLNAFNPADADPLEVRNIINSTSNTKDVAPPTVHSVNDITIEPTEGRSTKLRIYRPSGQKNLPHILFIHGGAWIAGSLNTHDNMARYLCQNTNAAVISVEYQNSPEGKFPLPLEQCYDALLWTSNEANTIAVAGDSAGGNLAAALSLLTRDRNGPKIELQVLINPVTDLSCEGNLEYQENSLDELRWIALMYVEKPEDVNSPYVSPGLAKDLTNLPPALVILAENDDLYQDGFNYSEKLRAAGVSVNTYCQWKTNHLAARGARANPSALESLDVACSALKGAFFRRE